MGKYLVRANYNGSGFQGMVSNPSDRDQAIRGITSALGISVDRFIFRPPLVKQL